MIPWILSFYIHFSVVTSKSCDINRPDTVQIFKKTNCTGIVVAVHSVWTETQCWDNCLRHPGCDKYIYNGEENETCKLLNTVDITAVVNLPKTTGACAPHNTTVSYMHQQFTFSFPFHYLKIILIYFICILKLWLVHDECRATL